MSLYPYVCKYFNFPLCHPKIHESDASHDKQAVLSMAGIKKCTVLPSKRLLTCPAVPLLKQVVILFTQNLRY